jgi:hypothetical protein
MSFLQEDSLRPPSPDITSSIVLGSHPRYFTWGPGERGSSLPSGGENMTSSPCEPSHFSQADGDSHTQEEVIRTEESVEAFHDPPSDINDFDFDAQIALRESESPPIVGEAENEHTGRVNPYYRRLSALTDSGLLREAQRAGPADPPPTVLSRSNRSQSESSFQRFRP